MAAVIGVAVVINCHKTTVSSHTEWVISGCPCCKDQNCCTVLTDGTGAHQADVAFQKCYDLDPSEVLNLDLSALVFDDDLGSTVDPAVGVRRERGDVVLQIQD